MAEHLDNPPPGTWVALDPLHGFVFSPDGYKIEDISEKERDRADRAVEAANERQRVRLAGEGQ